MTIGEVFASRLVEVRGVAHEFETSNMAAWVGVCQIGWRLVDARAGSSWTKTRDLVAKHRRNVNNNALGETVSLP